MSYNITGALQGGNITLSKAGLVAGTTTTYTIGTTFTFANQGKLFSKASASNAATPTTDFNTGVAFLPIVAGQSCLFVFCVDVSGTVRVIQSLPFNLRQSQFTSTLDITGGYAALQFPSIPDSLTPFGYMSAEAISTLVGTWTFGVNNLAAGTTGLTLAFTDVMALPAQPVTA
jgi:hypothetical protein